MVRETPAGRTVQLTVWRDGRTQTISVQLSSLRDRFESRARVLAVPDLDFKLAIPRIEVFAARTPTLGIDAEDLSGQLGEYFGAPGGEGVLVRDGGLLYVGDGESSTGVISDVSQVTEDGVGG